MNIPDEIATAEIDTTLQASHSVQALEIEDQEKSGVFPILI